MLSKNPYAPFIPSGTVYNKKPIGANAQTIQRKTSSFFSRLFSTK